MFSQIGIPGIILILVIILVAFGPKKLPSIGRSVGISLKEFKDGVAGSTNSKEELDSKTNNSSSIVEINDREENLQEQVKN